MLGGKSLWWRVTCGRRSEIISRITILRSLGSPHGVEITDLTSLNTDKGSMGLTTDMFFDNELCHADCRMYVVGRTTGQVGSAIKP
jgi:hypothetical protein